jgi:hypothetical protein
MRKGRNIPKILNDPSSTAGAFRLFVFVARLAFPITYRLFLLTK